MLYHEEQPETTPATPVPELRSLYISQTDARKSAVSAAECFGPCRNPGLNQGPLDLQSNALPTELFRPTRGWHAMFHVRQPPHNLGETLKKVQYFCQFYSV